MIGLRNFRALAAAALVLTAGVASAATTTLCPADADGVAERQFTLTTEAPITNSCFFAAPGNDNNNAEFQDALAALVPSATLLGKIEIKDGVLDSTGPYAGLLTDMIDLLGDNGGEFNIDLTGIVNAILVFKVGGGQVSPDFAAFRVGSGEVEGFWSNIPRQGGGLSHVSLYGVAAIPVPAAGFLLLGALGGLVALRRRHRAA